MTSFVRAWVPRTPQHSHEVCTPVIGHIAARLNRLRGSGTIGSPENPRRECVPLIEIPIQSLAYGGDSVGRLPDGRAAFVAGGCPGDLAAIEIVEDRGRFVRARLVEVVEASRDRVDAPCPYFGVCGGCTWQHVSYSMQLASKRQAVVDALVRIGGIAHAETIVAGAVPSRAEYGYRNKIELVPDPDSPRLRLGYHRAGSSEVVPVDQCLLLPKKLRKAPRALGGALRYLEGDRDLGLVRLGIRAASHTKDVEVAVWTAPGPFPRAVAARTLGQALAMSSLVRVLSKDPAKRRSSAGVEVLSGRGHWRERLAGMQFAVSAPSFFQVNTASAEGLIGAVVAALDPNGSERVLDLYAGVGTFTLPLAQLAGDVVAVEAAGSAVRDLRRNLELNEVWAEVLGGDAAREIAGLGHFDVAVVDPPRAGLPPEVISAISAARPRAIAYVSCDPATLARDAKLLGASGMTLTSATPVDLFPQTYHVETVAIFES